MGEEKWCELIPGCAPPHPENPQEESAYRKELPRRHSTFHRGTYDRSSPKSKSPSLPAGGRGFYGSIQYRSYRAIYNRRPIDQSVYGSLRAKPPPRKGFRKFADRGYSTYPVWNAKDAECRADRQRAEFHISSASPETYLTIQQATQWFGLVSRNSGSFSEQIFSAMGQRGWKRHPLGG